MKPSMFTLAADSLPKLIEYGEFLTRQLDRFEDCFFDPINGLGPDFQKVMLLDCPSFAHFKQLRLNAINTLLWNKLLDLVGFETFYSPCMREALLRENTPVFGQESAQKFIDQHGTVNEVFKDLIAKEITALVDAGKWDKDILENGRVIGMRFSYPAVIKNADHYVLDQDLKRVMLRLDFMSFSESQYRYSQHNSRLNLSDERVLPELHFNIGSTQDRIHLLAYETYFILMAPKYMEDLISKEEYLVPV